MVILQIEDIITALDLIGIASCAAAGSILAIRKGLDIFGILLISSVASLGGGTVRDLLLDNHPIFWMDKIQYVIVVTVVSLVTLLFYKRIEIIEKPLRIFDVIGLASFTIIGIEVALQSGASQLTALIMGGITATVGGILRDIICNEIPLELHKEIYITASLLGGAVFLLLHHYQVGATFIYSATLLVTFGVRVLAIYKDLRLPRFN